MRLKSRRPLLLIIFIFQQADSGEWLFWCYRVALFFECGSLDISLYLKEIKSFQVEFKHTRRLDNGMMDSLAKKGYFLGLMLNVWYSSFIPKFCMRCPIFPLGLCCRHYYLLILIQVLVTNKKKKEGRRSSRWF